jgi:hypothetical protein
MVSTTRYRKIKQNMTNFKLGILYTHVPSPIEADYKRGYIKRYFVQKVNDVNSYIFEIDTNIYQRYVSSELYSAVMILWKISGDSDEIKKANQASIKTAFDKIPKLKNYLPNLLQFSKV